MPGMRDRGQGGAMCILLDDSVVTCHSFGQEVAEPNFKGFGYHPPLGCCDTPASRLS
jgi:hypothetical protein